LLRRPIAARIRYGAELTGCASASDGPGVTWRNRADGTTRHLGEIDLPIAADGRTSLIRTHALGSPEVPSTLGVCLYRVLFPAGADPVAGTWLKTGLAFMAKLGRLYRDVPLPLGLHDQAA
jgi:2-polyprenyl-6-methoxyphenol hydroxylase-like FAD-dependent oxidoreductase